MCSWMEATRSALLLGPVRQPRALKTLRIQLEAEGARRARSPFLGAEDGERFVVEFDHEAGLGAERVLSRLGLAEHRILGSWRP